MFASRIIIIKVVILSFDGVYRIEKIKNNNKNDYVLSTLSFKIKYVLMPSSFRND